MLDPAFPIPEVHPLPKTIDPCPIIETVLQLQFQTDLPWAVLPGLVFLAVKDKYPNQKILPLHGIPDEIRNHDVNLKQQPHIEFWSAGGDSHVRLGPQMISLNFAAGYPGWPTIAAAMGDLIAEISKSSFTPRVERLGLRYIDFFDENIVPSLRLAATVDGQHVAPRALSIQMQLQSEEFTALLQVHSRAALATKPGREGSVLDVDVWTLWQEHQPVEACTDWFDRAHHLQKRIFFGLIKPADLEQFNPKY